MNTTLVLNILNGATTQYANYAFDEMCMVGDVTLGIKSGGLYRLDHYDTDDGVDIEAGFATASLMFDTTRRKRVRKIKIIGDSTDAVRVTVGVDGKSFTEYFFDRNKIAHCQAKKSTGGIFSFMFQNVSGSRFKLSMVEATVMKVS